jgi:hypothetical protein
MNTKNQPRTSREIAADIDVLRRQMDTTLDQIELRLSPRQLIREAAVSLGRLQAGRKLVSAAQVARRHPVGAVAATAGVALAVSLWYAWRNQR